MATIRDLWHKRDGSPTPRCGTGDRWQVRWVLPGGVERSRTFPDGKKTLAQQFKTKVEHDLLHGQFTDPRAGRVPLRSYVVDDWLPHQTFSLSTREAVERRWRLHIEPVLGDRPLSSITPTVVRGWLAGLGAAPSTVRALVALLSSILASAVDDGRIRSNPVRAQSVKAPRLEKRRVIPWTAEQVAVIRAAMPPRWAAMVDAGASAGLRISEACALGASDIDFLRRVIHVRRQVQRVGGRMVFAPPKGGRERDVPLPQPLAVALSEHIRAFPPTEVELPWKNPGGKLVTAQLLFTMPSGKVIEQNWWNASAWHKARKAAGIPPGRDAGYHQLRHFYASSLVSEGVDIVSVSGALGHHSAAFTLSTYAHLMPSAGDRIRAVLDRRGQIGTPPEREAGTGR